MNEVIKAAIALIAAIISAFVIPWLKKKVEADKLEELLKWVDIAVTAAEQLYGNKPGSERKEYVCDFLREKGYDVTSAEIENAIEAAVLKLHKALEA